MNNFIPRILPFLQTRSDFIEVELCEERGDTYLVGAFECPKTRSPRSIILHPQERDGLRYVRVFHVVGQSLVAALNGGRVCEELNQYALVGSFRVLRKGGEWIVYSAHQIVEGEYPSAALINAMIDEALAASAVCAEFLRALSVRLRATAPHTLVRLPPCKSVARN